MTWDNDRTNFERNIAVVIGIDHYDSGGIHDLQTAVSDANAIANLLRDKYGYKEEHIFRLFSPKNDEAKLKQPYLPATLEGLKRLLTETLPNQLKPTEADRLLFYFAGHGIARNNDKDGPAGYLVPQTGEQGNPNSFLSMRELHDALSKLGFHHLLIILDCCFAGTFRWASSRKLMPILEKVHKEHYDRFIRYPAWQVITSAAHDQEALDLSKDQRSSAKEDTEHSPFALALIKGLRDDEADLFHDNVITAHELYLYVDRRVNELSNEMQTPGIYPMRVEYDKGEYIFTRPGFKRDDLTLAPLLNENNNPYRGLKPFEEKHSDLFFGRKTLVEKLLCRLADFNSPLTVVLGASGSGKSSLVQAGLLPNLRKKQDKENAAQDWYILHPMRPGKSPFRELARAFLPVANNNLIANLAQVSFLDKTFAEIVDSNSKQPQKAANLNPTQSEIREQSLGDEAFDVHKLAECWNNATPEAKLLLIVDYSNLLKRFDYQPQEQAQLSSLYGEINSFLDQLTKALQDKDPQYFIDLIAKWSQKKPETKLLLVIDQFEELITMSQDKRGSGEQSDLQEQNEYKEQEWFLSHLRIALNQCPQQLHIVLTLRSDFEPRFLNSELKDYWKNARFPVQAMNFNELRDAIEGPALKQALYFEPPELVGELINEVGQMPGGLALLSFTLSELYIKLYERWTKDNATDRALRIKDYEELGGVAGTLTRRANQEYNNLVKKFGEVSGKAYQATMRRAMLRMVAIEGGGVARRRVLASELEYSDPPEEKKRVEDVIEQLVNVRLLVKGHEDKAQYVEPAHDLLIQGWGLLQDWIKDEQENLLLQNRLAAPTLDWKNAKNSAQDPDQFLWKQDPRIELLENIAKSKNSWLNKLELAFVKACIELRDKQAREKLENDIEFNTTTAEKLFNANDRVDAIFQLIKTGRTLQKGPKITEYKRLLFIIQFNHLLSEFREINGIDIESPVNNFSCNQDSQVIATVSGLTQRIDLWDWNGKRINFEDNEDTICDLVFSPDGKTFVTGGEDGIVKFYSRQLNGSYSLDDIQGDTKKHRSKVNCINFSPDGNILVSAGNDRKIIFWSGKGFIPTTLIDHKYPVEKVVFNPKYDLIAFTQYSLNNDAKKDLIYIMEYQLSHDKKYQACIDNKYLPIETGMAEGISAIDFSPNGKFLVASSWSGDLQIWSISKDKEHKMLEWGSDEVPISYVAFSPDGKLVASSHTNGIINLWDTSRITDAPSYYELQKIQSLAGHKKRITKISFTSDLKSPQLLSSSHDRAVKFWSFRDKFEAHVGDKVRKVSFSANNQIITTVDETGNVKLWKANGEQLEFSFENKSKICDAQMSRDNEVIVVVASDGEVAVSWYSLNETIVGSSIQKHGQTINRLNFSPNEDIFVTENEDNTIDVWRLNRYTNKINLLNTLKGHQKEITAITFSVDGKFFASGSNDADGEVKFWKLDANQEVQAISNVGGSIVHLSLSDDGEMIGVVIHSKTEGYKIKLYRRLTDNFIERWCSVSTDKITALRFYDENKIIVSIDEAGYIEIWDIELTKAIRFDNEVLKEQEPKVKYALEKIVEAAAFSANGEEIVMATCLNDREDSYRRIQTLNLNLDNLIKTAMNRHPNYLELKDIATAVARSGQPSLSLLPEAITNSHEQDLLKAA